MRMILLHVTDTIIAAGMLSLYNHAKAAPEGTVVAVFIAMMQARSEKPEIEVQVQDDEHRH
jgi:hypothetical protein